MVKRILAISLVFFLILSPMVLALNTDFTFRAKKSTSLVIKFFKAGTAFKLETFQKMSDENGEIKLSYDSPQKKIDLSMIIRDSGGTRIKKIKNIETGTNVFIDLNLDEPKPIITKKVIPTENKTNEKPSENNTKTTPQETSEPTIQEEPKEQATQQNIEQNSNSGVTGKAVGQTQSSNYTIIYYIIGIIIAVIILFIIIFLILKMKNKNDEPEKALKSIQKQVNKLDLKRKKPLTKDIGNINEEKELRDAEEKLRQAQAELAMIKNKKKIEEAERKLAEDQARLRALKQGIDPDQNQ